jgi:hypothetical protein
MKAVVEVDGGELVLFQQELHLIREERIGDTFRGSEPGAVRLACEAFLNLAKISPRDRVANEQHSWQVVLVGVGDPDVGPFDPFSDRLLGGCKLGDEDDGDQCGERSCHCCVLVFPDPVDTRRW